jgi:hypothetical protein
MTGICNGFTTPSVTRVGVIGEPANRAFRIGFEQGVDAWFAPGLIEVIDLASGTEITAGSQRVVHHARGR